MNMWETIFSQSRVNDGYYDEQGLPEQSWRWPTATWFQARLWQVREQEPTVFRKSLRSLGATGAAGLN